MGKFIHPSISKLKKEKQSNPYWVTNCTYNIEFKYSYDKKSKIKIRQTQSC
jgi:hypothetical protein